MHILIAPNAFKGALSATQAAEAIGSGLLRSRLQCTVECFPVADGGDGTAELLVRSAGGRTLAIDVHDPLGRPIQASLGLIDDDCAAVIESADASGLKRLRPEERDPLHATTFGTGELIRKALDLEVDRIVLGVGGTATVDGGAGLLRALGVRFLDAAGRELTTLPLELPALDRLDLAQVDSRLGSVQIILACDVTNPLLGPHGAVAVFGPQKGATPADMRILATGLSRLNTELWRRSGDDPSHVPRGGAGGGVVAALRALFGVQVVSGIDYFLQATRFSEFLNRSDIVITGEGCLDEQTVQGKAPHGVAVRAKALNRPVIALTGRIAPEANKSLEQCFDAVLTIGQGPMDLQQALLNAYEDLERTAAQLGNLLSIHGARFRRSDVDLQAVNG